MDLLWLDSGGNNSLPPSILGEAEVSCQMSFWKSHWKKKLNLSQGNETFLEPFDDPCFDWKRHLFWRGQGYKIEDKQVPGCFRTGGSKFAVLRFVHSQALTAGNWDDMPLCWKWERFLQTINFCWFHVSFPGTFSGWCSTPNQLLICSSFSRKKWPSFAHLLITKHQPVFLCMDIIRLHFTYDTWHPGWRRA